jgi:ribosome-interacting GTPase 1
MQIQTLQERVQEAETEYGACEADRGKLRQRLAQLSERLEELQNTSGQIVSGEFLEGSGKGEYKFPRPPKQRRGSGVLQ